MSDGLSPIARTGARARSATEKGLRHTRHIDPEGEEAARVRLRLAVFVGQVFARAGDEGGAQVGAAERDHRRALDRQLDEHGYIVPGLGDAGDRIFGTK